MSVKVLFVIKHVSSLAFVFCLLTPFALARGAENWPSWRGPTSNGVAAGKGFPLEWSATENVAWKVKLPGHSGSTPVVWGDRIVLTCPGDGKNLVLCFDRSGKKLWEQTLGEERRGKHRKGSGSNPSPVTDGTHVWVYYKSGDIACLDFEGKIIWQKNLQKEYGEDTLWWDLGTSPVLTAKHVVVACMQTGNSYVVALDKASGKPAWKHDRNLDAPVEAAQSYSTPMVVEHDGRETIVILGADHVTAHEADTGKEIWRVGGLNPTAHQYFRSIASPVVSGSMVVAPYARGGTLTGISLGGAGDVTASHVKWTREGVSSDVPTPAAVDGRVYVCTDNGTVACLDIATGKTIWSEQVERSRKAFSASPIVADGKVWVTREDGKVYVLRQGDSYELLAQNEIGDEFTLASPVFVDGKILIRTFDHLYCIGK